ncbi:MAG: hypothetical protein Q9O74_03815 [Planctomycetota bacterium]|nr:hypothetical protein [Planctomycetota bacterium]
MPIRLNTFQATDDRGTTIDIPPPGLATPNVDNTREPHNVWLMHRRVLWSRHVAASRPIRLSLGVLAAAMTLVVVRVWRDPVSWTEQLLVLPFTALSWVWFLWWKACCRLTSRRWVSALRTATPVCPSCGYELTGVPKASDGCTLCPECGAAWKLGTSPASQRLARGGDG